MDFNRIAQEFPGTSRKAYLDAACVSITPRSAVTAIQQFLDMALVCSAESSTQLHLNMDAMRRQALSEAAVFLHTGEENLALVESTTHGLNLAGRGLPLEPGSQVLVGEMEFLQVAMPWVMMKDQGIEVLQVPAPGGRVLPEVYEKYITPKTRLIALSSTSWNNGFRCDIKAFSELCRKHNLYLVVDAIQNLGAVRFYPGELDVDIMVAGGHKWLNAPYGCGIMYVSPRVIDEIKPSYWGYLNLEDPEGGWGTYFSCPDTVGVRPYQEYHFTNLGKKLEIGGTSNYPGAIGLAASLRLVNELGHDAIEEHILSLTDYLMENLPSTGATLVTVPERAYRSGIVSFRFYNDIEEERALTARLCSEGVLLSIRFTANIGGVRASCHYFNTQEHLDALLEGLRRAAKTKAPDYRAS